ncbi:hypothetical protein [Alteribacillus sp. HJP-4]|uniref:hypothetical protein n=1 Tax=Alteribacillus sp. HJP-4 TaxID=2775394 RepID=UPI0035CCFB30
MITVIAKKVQKHLLLSFLLTTALTTGIGSFLEVNLIDQLGLSPYAVTAAWSAAFAVLLMLSFVPDIMKKLGSIIIRSLKKFCMFVKTEWNKADSGKK